jgi:hypothetical protein
MNNLACDEICGIGPDERLGGAIVCGDVDEGYVII